MTRVKRGQVVLELYILRHGDAGTPLDDPGKDDERPLSKEGREEMKKVAEAIHELEIKFDVIATSPLPRALQTAEAVAREYKKLNKIEEWEELKYSADTESLYSRLSKQKKGSSILIVGHEPHLTGLIAEIIAGTSNVNLVLKKAGLAMVGVLAFKPKITGELRLLLPPKTLLNTA
jgi:phosphohistidine phosphatase